MDFSFLSIDYDRRIRTFAVTGRTTYSSYLETTAGAEYNLNIQRDIIKSRKTYQTLREDLKRGCILPPIVLSVQNLQTPDRFTSSPNQVAPVANAREANELENAISIALPKNFQIIDGLQRTNALRSVQSELIGDQLTDFLAHPLRLEIWINIPFYSLAYRMLLLNAGQKPMSMKHQIEILAENMRLELLDIDHLEVIRGIDKRRRVKPGQFQLASLASAFQAWIQKKPNVDIRNAVTEQLLADDAVDELGKGLAEGLGDQKTDFRSFVEWMVKLDLALGQENAWLLQNETVIQAIAAAISSSYSKPELRHRCEHALDRLLNDINERGPEEAFGADRFDEFRQEIDPKRRNIGEATRDLVYRALSEYIISDGMKSMPECWNFAGSYL